MKRIISLLLCITMLLSSANVILADEVKEDVYNTVSVEFSDNAGSLEKLQVMVKDDNVYANAEELGTRLGYDVSVFDEYVSIYNKEADENVPYGLTVFYYDSTKVEHMLFTQMVDSYEAPFETKKNENGVWIPLEYSLLLLNSSMLIVDNTICIDMPTKNIIDIYMDISQNNQKYLFDWQDDIGISEKNENTMQAASFMVALFNGLLELDGESWAQGIQIMALDTSAYDAKYGEELAMLFCTYSDDELSEAVKDMEKIMEPFNGESALSEAIDEIDKELDKNIGDLLKTSNELKSKIDANNNASIVAYNKSYQALEDACDKADFFSDATELYTKVGKGVAEATNFLEGFYTVAEVVGFANEFKNQDKFAVNALMEFVENSDSQSVMSTAMKEGISAYAGTLQTDIVAYSGLRWLEENYDKVIFEKMKLTSALGLPANLMLIGWDIASDKMDFFKDGLDDTEKFMLSMYASIFQADSFISYQNLRNVTFDNMENITPENLYEVSQYCYTYLKSCYITRNATLGSLSEENKKKIPSVIEYQNAINEDIAEYLVQLKNANTTNEYGCYGFLPKDNEMYLEKNSQDTLLDVINKVDYTEIVTEAYKDFISQGAYNQYTQNWGNVAEKYGVLDINNDGIPELFINSANMGAGWFNTLIFTYKVDTSEIVFVSDEYNYAGIRYSTKYNAILYTDIKPSAMCGSEGFYELQGSNLKFMFSVGHDTDENGKYCFYYNGTTSNNITEDDRKEYFKDLVEIEYIELPNNPQMNGKTEVELLSIMETKIGCEVENYKYIDMNLDGANELIGVYSDGGYYQTWYCSSDGELCEMVHENDRCMEYAVIEALNVESETHIVVNAYMSMGTNKNYSIFALRDKKIVSVISNQYGTVYTTDNGNIALSVEAYDGFYDPSIDGLMVHTWKNTYIFFDGTTYKEYGATELSEEDYLKFQNATIIKEKIDSEIREADTTSLEYKYFKRSNGIMHIQCNVHNDSGEIKYGYYTVRYSNNILENEIEEYNQGQMGTNFSNLEVVY